MEGLTSLHCAHSCFIDYYKPFSESICTNGWEIDQEFLVFNVEVVQGSAVLLRKEIMKELLK